MLKNHIGIHPKCWKIIYFSTQNCWKIIYFPSKIAEFYPTDLLDTLPENPEKTLEKMLPLEKSLKTPGNIIDPWRNFKSYLRKLNNVENGFRKPNLGYFKDPNFKKFRLRRASLIYISILQLSLLEVPASQSLEPKTLIETMYIHSENLRLIYFSQCFIISR